jgi:membrane-bound ClpP family serine protease
MKKKFYFYYKKLRSQPLRIIAIILGLATWHILATYCYDFLLILVALASLFATVYAAKTRLLSGYISLASYVLLIFGLITIKHEYGELASFMVSFPAISGWFISIMMTFASVEKSKLYVCKPE